MSKGLENITAQSQSDFIRVFSTFLGISLALHILFLVFFNGTILSQRETIVRRDVAGISLVPPQSLQSQHQWGEKINPHKGKEDNHQKGSGDKQYVEACSLLGEHKYDESIALFNSYLEKHRDGDEKYDALVKRADAYVGLNEYDKAEKDLKEVIGKGKKGATPYLYLAIMYHSLDRDAEAYEALKKAYQLNPDLENDSFFNDRTEKNYNKQAALADFYTIAGKIAHDAGHSEEGLKYIDLAIKIGPLSPISSLAYLEKALIYFKMERYDEAKKYAQIWLDKYAPPTIIAIESHENFSDAYMMIGEYDKALEHINDLIKLKPGFAGLYINRGRIYLRMGDYDSARKDFAMVRKIAYSGESYDAVELARLEKLLERAKR